jgi:hypothetical protein
MYAYLLQGLREELLRGCQLGKHQTLLHSPVLQELVAKQWHAMGGCVQLLGNLVANAVQQRALNRGNELP